MVLRLSTSERGLATHLEIVGKARQDNVSVDESLVTAVVECLGEADKPMSRTEIRQRLGVRNQTLGTALQRLSAEGLIHRDTQGWLPQLDGGQLPSPESSCDHRSRPSNGA